MLASPLRSPLVRTGKYGLRAPVDTGGKVSAVDHQGVDVRAAVGTPFFPIAAGKVVQVVSGWTSERNVGTSYGSRFFKPGMGGNQVVVQVTPDLIDNYGHAQAITTKVGAVVGLDSRLGLTGASGGDDMAPHLHVGRWRRVGGEWVSVDLTPLLPWDGDKFGELRITDKASAGVPVEDAMDAKQYEEFKQLLTVVERRTLKAENDHANQSKLLASLRGAATAVENGINWLKQRLGGSVLTDESLTASLNAMDQEQLRALADEVGRRISNG